MPRPEAMARWLMWTAFFGALVYVAVILGLAFGRFLAQPQQPPQAHQQPAAIPRSPP